MYKNEMQTEFLAISQNEAFARSVAAAFASQLNPTIEELTDIRTAVSEAVTNAIIHGYGGDASRSVKLSGAIIGGSITFSVSDEGKGIEDIELAMTPFYTSAPNLERSGMGFTVMETFMDEVKVDSEKGRGTLVTMKKIISTEKCNE